MKLFLAGQLEIFGIIFLHLALQNLNQAVTLKFDINLVLIWL